MKKTIVATEKAPAAVGPYSQAAIAGELVFCSGQIPLDPATGELVGGAISDQTRRCMQNLSAVLEEAGTSLANLIQVRALLAITQSSMMLTQSSSGLSHRPAQPLQYRDYPGGRGLRSSASHTCERFKESCLVGARPRPPVG